MREIKFRAYHRGYKEWYCFTLDSLVGDGGGTVSIDGNAYGVTLGECEARSQYTGQKDKNNIEIYEGNIVEVFDANNGIIRGAIVWNPKDSCYDVNIDEFEVWELYEAMQKDEVEVIGNIYENPELLKN